MIIYPISSKISVKIGKLTFWISPLTLKQKIDLANNKRVSGGKEIVDEGMFCFEAVRKSVKKVEGLTLPDGSDYELTFGDDGDLTEECASEVLQVGCKQELLTSVNLLISEIKEHKIKGVKISLPNGMPKKKSIK